MSRTGASVSAVAAMALASGATVLIQFAGSSSADAATSAADATFVTANEQSNLAEISLGKLGGKRGQDAATKDLASTTLSDHQTAKGKLTAAAKSAGASLPAAPNTMQLTVAAQLTSAPTGSFDLMYAQAEVAGHEMALAAARKELGATKNAALKTYTKYYIGIATMHLHMAQAEVTALGGSPTAVPAGSGGGAATNATGSDGRDLSLGAGALLVLAGLGVATRRRLSAPR